MEELGGARSPARSSLDHFKSPAYARGASSSEGSDRQPSPSSRNGARLSTSRMNAGGIEGRRRPTRATTIGTTGWDGFIGFGGNEADNPAHSGSSFLSRPRPRKLSEASAALTPRAFSQAPESSGRTPDSPYSRAKGASLPFGTSPDDGEAVSVRNLLGPMSYERPLGGAAASATAAAAAAVLADCQKRDEDVEAPHYGEFEGVPKLEPADSVAHYLHNRSQASQRARGSSRRDSSLSASAILRLMGHISPWKHATEADHVVATTLDRMVELVAFRSASAESPGLLAGLEHHQATCFAVEQQQAEQKQVAERMKKMLAKKPRSDGRTGGAASHRQRLQQAKAAAAMLEGAGGVGAAGGGAPAAAAEARPRALLRRNSNAGVLYAEGHLASPSPPSPSGGSSQTRRRSQSASKARTQSSPTRRRPTSGMASGGSSYASAATRTASARQKPWAGGSSRAVLTADHGVIAAGASTRKASGRDTGREPTHFSYQGYSYATANIHTLAGCGSVAIQKRVQQVAKQQLDTVKAEKKRGGG